MSKDFTKIIRLDERFPGTGEPTMQVIDTQKLGHVKVASEALEYIKSVKPVDGKTIVLVLAMSASEFTGANRNGDAFSERPVPGLVEAHETLPEHYKSFEKAHAFRHHVNKDVNNAIGKVLKAFYNWDMHRVELLIELDNEKAADIVDKIKKGQFPACSMGSRIREDRCNICGNKAPTRAQYCDHLRYEMNRVYPDGRKAFCWNPSPDFFDISFVIRPADPVGFMMKKVAYEEPLISSAELGEKVSAQLEKQSTIKKLSDMDKRIQGQVADYAPKANPLDSFIQTQLPRIIGNSPELDDNAINELSKYSLPESLSTLTGMGITPTSPEITRMMLARASPGAQLPAATQDRMSAMSGSVLQLLEQHPEILDALMETGILDMGPDKARPELAQKMAGWMEKRSNFSEYLLRRAQPFRLIGGEPHPDVGNWDLSEVADRSGNRFVTTQGAMDKADDTNVEREMKALAGAGLLAGAGYKVLTAGGKGRYAAPLALAGAGLGANAVRRLYHVPTLQREGPEPTADRIMGYHLSNDVPINAEMYKSSSDAGGVILPMASSAAITAMLGQEYKKRLENGQMGSDHPGFMGGLEQTAHDHPLASFLAGLGGIGFGAHQLAKLESFIKNAVDENGIKTAEVDLSGLASWVGEGLFS